MQSIFLEKMHICFTHRGPLEEHGVGQDILHLPPLFARRVFPAFLIIFFLRKMRDSMFLSNCTIDVFLCVVCISGPPLHAGHRKDLALD